MSTVTLSEGSVNIERHYNRIARIDLGAHVVKVSHLAVLAQAKPRGGCVCLGVLFSVQFQPLITFGVRARLVPFVCRNRAEIAQRVKPIVQGEPAAVCFVVSETPNTATAESICL